jgi:hypothetical protein
MIMLSLSIEEEQLAGRILHRAMLGLSIEDEQCADCMQSMIALSLSIGRSSSLGAFSV